MERTNTTLERLNLKTGKDLTLVANKSDFTFLADNVESFKETCYSEDKSFPFYFVSLLGYTWDAWLKYRKLKIDKPKKLVFDF